MAFQIYWRHLNITDSGGEGRVTVQSANPSGTHAVIGGGWVGGDSSNSSLTGQDAGFLPIIAQYPDYDSGTDTTVWSVVFGLPKYASVRAHVFAIVEVP